jgi:ABC-type sugar transport system substrate-binding protein
VRNLHLRLAVSIAVLALAAVGLAACGGGSSSSSTGAEPAATEAESKSTTASETAAATVPAPPEAPPTEVPITTPLKSKPPSGKKVVFLQCELPACQRYVKGLEDAAKALGWSLETLVFKSEDPASGMQQAISKNPDYIAITGVPTSVMKPQMAEAAKAGIPVISCASPEKPEPNGFAAQCGGSLVRMAEYTGAWIINDSGGEGHVLGVTIPIYPVLTSETDWFKGKFTELCPKCSYEELDITTEHLGAGSVPQEVVGYLQSHPDIEYVYNTFGGTPGMPAALNPAGFSDVKLTGGPGEEATIQEIAKGEQTAWTTNGNEYDAWVMFDAMARLAAGEKISKEYEDTIYVDPTWVIASPETAESLKKYGWSWPGPGNFQQQFKDLWKVE